MNSHAQWFLALGSLNAAISVALGAAGAHALKAQLAASDPAGWFAVALQYHQYHSLGLMLIGLATIRLPESKWFAWSGWLMFSGLFLFSGNLYLLSLAGAQTMRATIPVGGLAFISAWLSFLIGILRLQRTTSKTAS